MTTVYGEVIEPTHALAWRSSSPARQLFREIAEEICALVVLDFSDDLCLAEVQEDRRGAGRKRAGA